MPKLAQIVRTRMLDGRVLSNTALTSRLYSLRIESCLLPFEAGQFVRLELTINDEKVAKPYSLVNVPDDPVAEVFFNTIANGHLSNALAALQAGDAVGISQPAAGFFTLAGTPAARQLWMVATGTGLGPYLSMLRTAQLWQQFEQVVLVHGVPRQEELVYQKLIAGVKGDHPNNFQYIPCVSREDCALGLRGRVTAVFDKGELELRAGFGINSSDSAVMLCGNHNMITEMQDLLGRRGLRKHLRHAPGQIISEQYF